MRRITAPAPQFICDASGFKFPLSEAVRQWDGALVHRKYVDRRNPQDFVRGRPDKQSLPYSRPESGGGANAVSQNAPLRIATPYDGTSEFSVRVRGGDIRTYEPFESLPVTDNFLFPNDVKPEDL